MDNANIAVLFKKGSTDNPENYRPIALLNTTYKILASIIQRRLAEGMDQAIDEMQFGFRKGRSTSQPLQIVRRTAEIVEEAGDSMYMLLIDWEKAFDKVDQERLIFALERMGIPRKIIGIIKKLYEKPNFAVKDRGRTSTRRRQRAGIRQGCPLSPYLFGILMTVIMEDVENGLTELEREGLRQGTPQRTGINKVFYADDTILLTTTKQSMENLLHSIERESAKYNMRLNKQKCVVRAVSVIRIR